MAPKIKLIYFDARGRAEMNRIMLTYGGVEFEDYIIKHEEWEEVKKSVANLYNFLGIFTYALFFQPSSLDSCLR